MRKRHINAVAALAFGLIFLGSAQAQQNPAAGGQAASPAAAQSTPGAKPAPVPAAKPGQTPATQGAAPQAFKSDKEKDSYAVGLKFGQDLKRQMIDVDLAPLERGLKDGMDGGKPLVTDEEMRAAFKQLSDDATKKLGEANLQEGEAFLAANKTKDGVVALPSGLQYKIITAGTGAKPTASDTVVCNYRLTSIKGVEIDSSYKRGQPATFTVGGVIKGWTEALLLMPVGSKWQLFVPSDLAYGASGRPGIDPNQTLVFDIELISIRGQQQQPGTPASK
jgi:FKBP-type peptidyl-prolyl cis-trans isomerase FklB